MGGGVQVQCKRTPNAAQGGVVVVGGAGWWVVVVKVRRLTIIKFVVCFDVAKSKFWPKKNGEIQMCGGELNQEGLSKERSLKHLF